MQAFLETGLYNNLISCAVCASECGFSASLRQWKIPVEIASPLPLSSFLIDRFSQMKEIFILNFSTDLFSDEFVETFSGRAFNFHPSLLPAFKGLNAIDRNFNSNVLFMGCSIHQIEKAIDGGKCLLQAFLPMDKSRPFSENRHKIFRIQLVTFIQLICG